MFGVRGQTLKGYTAKCNVFEVRGRTGVISSKSEKEHVLIIFVCFYLLTLT